MERFFETLQELSRISLVTGRADPAHLMVGSLRLRSALVG